MHNLMNFIGAIGTFMIDTGFGWVVKMLPGKKYPQNMRTLRIIVEKLLREEFNKKKYYLLC